MEYFNNFWLVISFTVLPIILFSTTVFNHPWWYEYYTYKAVLTSDVIFIICCRRSSLVLIWWQSCPWCWNSVLAKILANHAVLSIYKHYNTKYSTYCIFNSTKLYKISESYIMFLRKTVHNLMLFGLVKRNTANSVIINFKYDQFFFFSVTIHPPFWHLLI